MKDKTTNVVTTRSTGLSLNTVFSKGWLLLGENENGEVQLDMLSFVGNDTVLMKDVLKESRFTGFAGTDLFVCSSCWFD